MRGVKGSSPICSKEGCDTVAYGRGWCQKHWARWRDTGRTDLRSPEELFWAKVDKHGPVSEYRPDLGPCWLWTGAGSTGRDGYGRYKLGDHLLQAHRIAYQWLVGPIPEGLTLDHLCRRPSCVRPDHLEPVTNRENILRGTSNSARNARKTHCHRGHPFDEANTYPHPSGGRDCRTCRNQANAAAKARREVAS
jgi:hypothetical protein